MIYWYELRASVGIPASSQDEATRLAREAEIRATVPGRDTYLDGCCLSPTAGLSVATRRAEILARLRALRGGDPESAHGEADGLLLELLGDAEISAAYEALEKWYA